MKKLILLFSLISSFSYGQTPYNLNYPLINMGVNTSSIVNVKGILNIRGIVAGTPASDSIVVVVNGQLKKVAPINVAGFMTTNTTQTGLTGNKTTSGTWTSVSGGNSAAISPGNFIAFTSTDASSIYPTSLGVTKQGQNISTNILYNAYQFNNSATAHSMALKASSIPSGADVIVKFQGKNYTTADSADVATIASNYVTTNTNQLSGLSGNKIWSGSHTWTQTGGSSFNITSSGDGFTTNSSTSGIFTNVNGRGYGFNNNGFSLSLLTQNLTTNRLVRIQNKSYTLADSALLATTIAALPASTVTSLTGTTAQVLLTTVAQPTPSVGPRSGDVTLVLPQSISTSSNVQFGSVLSGLARISTWSNNSSFARFGHTSFDTPTNYGFLQQSNGDVYMSGGNVFLTGTVAVSTLGTGAVQATSGVLSVISDSHAKDLSGTYKGSAMSAIMKLSQPQYWNYNIKSGLPKSTFTVKQFGLLADKVHAELGEEFAPTQPSKVDGQDAYGLSDRALLSLTIQALQEANKRIESLELLIKK